MAFFNLTQLGVQEPIRMAVKDEHFLSAEQQPSSRAASQVHRQTTPQGPSLPPSAAPQRPVTVPQSFNHSPYGQSVVRDVSDARGSYVRYTERLTKHQRSAYAPSEVYTKPITSSQDYGWFQANKETMPWAHVDRHAKVNSEMTRCFKIAPPEFEALNCLACCLDFGPNRGLTPKQLSCL